MDTETDVEIVQDNLQAMAALYFAYMLEELRIFQVVDRIVEVSMQGTLTIGSRAAREKLQELALPGDRLTEAARRSLYARGLGDPRGDAGDVQSNGDFLSLWMRFLVAVAAAAQETGKASALSPPSAGNAAARKAAHDLASNLSRHGYGIAHFAAVELVRELEESIGLLGNPDVRAAYGARDAWQVIDRVNASDLGGARNVARYRTLATEGYKVLQWLAERADSLDDAGTPVPPSEQSALVDAVERVLAASGASDDASRDGGPRPPFDVRRSAHDLLDAIGARARERPGAGLTVLHGQRGTGKTLAAFLLGQGLGTDVYRVDVAAVVSRYIGDTEKNIDRVFRDAEERGAVLFFDEADALFGQRTGVGDAQDRYANAAVGYLLQRLESYQGLVIVATNGDAASDGTGDDDKARQRRLVRFPRP